MSIISSIYLLIFYQVYSSELGVINKQQRCIILSLARIYNELHPLYPTILQHTSHTHAHTSRRVSTSNLVWCEGAGLCISTEYYLHTCFTPLQSVSFQSGLLSALKTLSQSMKIVMWINSGSVLRLTCHCSASIMSLISHQNPSVPLQLARFSCSTLFFY